MNNKTKKTVYIILFGFLGLLCSLVVYGLGSIYHMRNGLQVDQNWFLVILVVAGTTAGLLEGVRWWRIIYVEKAYLKWPTHKWGWWSKCLSVGLFTIFTVAIVLLSGNY